MEEGQAKEGQAGDGQGDKPKMTRQRALTILGQVAAIRLTGCLIEVQSNTTFFTRHTHRSRPGPDLVQTSVQTQPNRPKRSRLPEKLKFQPCGLPPTNTRACVR